MRSAWLVACVVVGCGGVVDPGSPDASPDSVAKDTMTEVAVDSAIDSAIISMMDAVAEVKPDKRWPITDKEADCMGLHVDPTCAGCHRRDGVWFLRPTDGPPPPPGIPMDPGAVERCGLKPP